MTHPILYVTLPLLLIIAYFQFINYRKYRYQGNGANNQRLAMVMGSIGAIGTCLGCFVHSFLVIAWSVSIVPIVGFIIYWATFKNLAKEFIAKLKK